MSLQTDAILARIRADLDEIRDLADLTRDGIGDRLCKAATDGVMDTIAAQQAPDGTPWDSLSESYAEWKAKTFPGQPIGHLHDLMASPEQVAGVPEVESDHAMVAYGTSDDAKQEAAWFQEGDEASNRPPRPFWGFTPASIAAIEAIMDERFHSIQ